MRICILILVSKIGKHVRHGFCVKVITFHLISLHNQFRTFSQTIQEQDSCIYVIFFDWAQLFEG